MFTKVFQFIKQEIVFTIAFLLAIVSCFFVHPSKEYLEYIDFHVLALLFCLMAVVNGFSSIGVFRQLGEALLQKLSGTRSLAWALILLCFFSSMLITNDVALITFVPFTILVLNLVQKQDLFIRFIVLETIAANLGSMLTPLGNPQNLYLYTISGMSLGTFILTLLPYSLVALVLLFLCTRFLPNDSITIQPLQKSDTTNGSSTDTPDNTGLQKPSNYQLLLVLYIVLFVLCLLVVLHVLPFFIVLAIVGITVLIFDRKSLKEVDYVLLLTFVCFFIFIGNMKNIPAVHQLLSEIIVGREFLSGVLASQVISNVPAAILLSGFTEQLTPLLVGVNIGGLGTLIASLASLISYKLYIKTADSKTSRYLLVFTLYNVIFLAIMIPLYYLLTTMSSTMLTVSTTL